MPNKIEPDTAVHVYAGNTASVFGARIPDVVTVTVCGKQIPGCKNCGLIECGCDIIAKHQARCILRMAATCAIAIPCTLHNDETCPTCYACDCKPG